MWILCNVVFSHQRRKEIWALFAKNIELKTNQEWWAFSVQDFNCPEDTNSIIRNSEDFLRDVSFEYVQLILFRYKCLFCTEQRAPTPQIMSRYVENKRILCRIIDYVFLFIQTADNISIDVSMNMKSTFADCRTFCRRHLYSRTRNWTKMDRNATNFAYDVTLCNKNSHYVQYVRNRKQHLAMP